MEGNFKIKDEERLTLTPIACEFLEKTLLPFWPEGFTTKELNSDPKKVRLTVDQYHAHPFIQGQARFQELEDQICKAMV